MLDLYCFYAKNLYNHANYLIREEFIKNNKWLRYQDLDKILREDKIYPDYRQMPTAQSAQQLLKQLDKNWKSFFKSIKDWSKHKDKYKGKPNLPNYKSKDGRCILTLTNQNVRFKDNMLYFPKTFNGFTLKPHFINKSNFVSFQQVRFIPKHNHIIVEVIYNVEVPELKTNNGRYLSIDIGVDNLATIANNIGKKPVIINGRGLKSVNQYFNKQKAHYQKIAKQANNRYITRRLKGLTTRRNQKIYDYMHKSSRFIVNYAKDNNISVIVIGHNEGWKQEVNMGTKTNQSFVQIPFNILIQQIQYKAQECGIQVILTEEAYTSGTSFLDNEKSIKANYNKSRRIHRGLFKSNNGTKINADVNAAYQIMKKVFPKEKSNGIEGIVLYPIKVDVA